ncbi:MAG TPA: ATP-binding protein [Longimicrobiales bacterium]
MSLRSPPALHEPGVRSALLIPRVALLALGLLLPLNTPFSLPPVGGEKLFGWSAGPLLGAAGGEHVATQVMRHAYTIGLQPGDVLLRINGVAADSATIARVREQAEPGDTIALLVRRGADSLRFAIPVSSNSASYSGYFWYRVLLALGAWVLGMAYLVWRGDHVPGLLLGAALLSLAPITLPSGVPGAGSILRAAKVGWHLQAAAHRFAFPALMFHFLSCYVRRPPLLRSPWFWWIIYGALLATLAAVTDLFRDPMAWAVLGPARELRTVAGLVFQLLAVGAACHLQWRSKQLPTALRWLIFAILLITATSAILSVSLIVWGERGVNEIVWRINGLSLLVLPVSAALFLPSLGAPGFGYWHQQRRLASSVSVLLTVLYGMAVAGAAAVVLSSTRRSLGGVEWLLFAAIFLATIIFSPVLRWAREMVDRRMFARWAELETLAHGFVDRVGAELEPHRIGRRVAREIPSLLDTPEATLVLVRELADAWGIDENAALACVPRDALAQRIRDEPDGLVPIYRPDGELMGAIRLADRRHGGVREPPEQAVLRTLAQGVAAALRNAESYLALRRAQQELAEGERVAAMGALAGGLAHEIKNPLAGLKMGLHLLERDGIAAARLQRIRRDVQRIDDLVTGLLRFTHDGATELPEPVELRQLVQACIADLRPMAEDRGITLLEHHPAEKVFVHGGRNQLRLIVSNLVANALGAVGDGGRVEVVLTARAATAELAIRDNGPGVPAGLGERIFDLNVSTRPGGTGLGLALARRETERLEGRIEIEPGARGGTVLHVVLPRAIY